MAHKYAEIFSGDQPCQWWFKSQNFKELGLGPDDGHRDLWNVGIKFNIDTADPTRRFQHYFKLLRPPPLPARGWRRM
jgi:hypothetical protein